MNTVHLINSEKDAVEYHKQERENIVDKFKLYRLGAETRERQLNEARAVVSKLKDEANLSKEVENNLILQISSAQKRLTQLQSTLNKFIIAADKQRQVEKTCHQIQSRLEELDKLVREAKKEGRSLSEKVTREADLVRKNEETKSKLAAKNSELISMKTKIESLIDEKFEFELRVKELEEEVEKRKRENTDMKSNWDQTLSVYKRQIEDNEERILEYERERRNLLEDFEFPKEPDGDPEFTWADSTVSINPEERSSTQNREKLPKDEEDIFCRSHPVIRSPLKRKKSRSSFAPKASSQRPREKPELEFLTQNQTSPVVPAKRTLFSPSFNHQVNLCRK